MSSPPSESAWLEPPVTELNAPFWEGVRAGELRIPRCIDTGRWVFPPRPASPYGGRRPLEWAAVSGRGRIWSWCRAHPPLLPPFDALAPYLVVAVELEEDPALRLVGNLVAREGGGIDELQRVAIDAAVEVVFAPVRSALVLPRWRLRG